MPYELMYSPEADAALAALEADPQMRPVREAVGRVELALANDPFSRRLRTTSFGTERWGNVNATPAGMDDWYVIWQRAPEPQVLDIIQVHALKL